MLGMPTTLPNCPRCHRRVNLVKVATSPSPTYEARTFACEACGFRYTARIDTDPLKLAEGWVRLGQE
jgi:transposase-like protein